MNVAMLGSYRLLILVKLILFQLLGLMCIENESFRRYRRLRSPITNNTTTNSSLTNSFVFFVSVSENEYYAVINCSTPDRVPHHKLDWYFQTHQSLKPPRVIWQRGRSNIQRYIAYSPDQFRHFLQIKPIHSNDSGTYMCLDQTTGYYAGVELIVHESPSCASRLSMTTFIALSLLSTVISQHITSESQIT